MDKDLYKVFGVERNATKAQIRSAYKKLAQIYHPDINKEKDAEEKFKLIQNAYSILMNDLARREYDKQFEELKSGKNNDLTLKDIVEDSLSKIVVEGNEQVSEDIYKDDIRILEKVAIGFLFVIIAIVLLLVFYRKSGHVRVSETDETQLYSRDYNVKPDKDPEPIVTDVESKANALAHSTYPLYEAIKSADKELVNYLLDNDMYSIFDKEDSSLVIMAISFSWKDVVEKLVDKGFHYSNSSRCYYAEGYAKRLGFMDIYYLLTPNDSFASTDIVDVHDEALREYHRIKRRNSEKYENIVDEVCAKKRRSDIPADRLQGSSNGVRRRR